MSRAKCEPEEIGPSGALVRARLTLLLIPPPRYGTRHQCQGEARLGSGFVRRSHSGDEEPTERSHLARVLRHRRFVTRLISVPPLVLLSGSCVVISDPQFEDPLPTAPVFLPDRSVPDARNIIKLDNQKTHERFSGLFVSEDDGKDLEARLFVDYGVITGEKPYVDVIIGNRIPAATLEDSAREAVATWTPGEAAISPGCHRMTLVVAHEWGDDGCPVSPGNATALQADYDTITWTVVRCDGECPPIDLEDLASQCPPADRSCAKSSEPTIP